MSKRPREFSDYSDDRATSRPRLAESPMEARLQCIAQDLRNRPTMSAGERYVLELEYAKLLKLVTLGK